jgi:Zn-finger nucleic acid-binding protein
MTDAGGLHCPNCGATSAPDARRCPYCQARLATVSCPSCFSLMFEGTGFCATCGAALARGEVSGEIARCPACQGQLQRIDIGKTTLLECADCDGAWIDATAFEALCADAEAQSAVLHRYGGRPAGRQRAVKYRRCVRCSKMMNRVNFGRLSGTVVDVCRGHGTYLDAGELHQIVSFIRGGGMARARQLQLDELRQQKEELEALEARARARDASTGRSAGWNDRSFLDFMSQLLTPNS